MIRVVLALAGVAVGCDVDPCRLHLQFCDDRSLLAGTRGESADTPSVT
ncbi:MAG TPA: hypothetical protein VMS64_34605 [Candidatus Methylomirabilis sp.]|nr:hypothetical protein [Candidatus Methylomirabilis sp.]